MLSLFHKSAICKKEIQETTLIVPIEDWTVLFYTIFKNIGCKNILYSTRTMELAKIEELFIFDP